MGFAQETRDSHKRRKQEGDALLHEEHIVQEDLSATASRVIYVSNQSLREEEQSIIARLSWSGTRTRISAFLLTLRLEYAFTMRLIVPRGYSFCVAAMIVGRNKSTRGSEEAQNRS